MKTSSIFICWKKVTIQLEVQSEPYGSLCTFPRLAKSIRNDTGHVTVAHEVESLTTQLTMSGNFDCASAIEKKFEVRIWIIIIRILNYDKNFHFSRRNRSGISWNEPSRFDWTKFGKENVVLYSIWWGPIKYFGQKFWKFSISHVQGDIWKLSYGVHGRRECAHFFRNKRDESKSSIYKRLEIYL